MGLRAWTVIDNGSSGSSEIGGGIRWRVTNTDEDRIEQNRSVLEIELFSYKRSSLTSYNTNSQISYYEITDQTKVEFLTKFDYRNANVLQNYYVGTDTAVFPEGRSHAFSVPHDSDGTKTIIANAFLNLGGTIGAPGLTSITEIELPAIPRGIMKVGSGGSYLDHLVYVGKDGSYQQCQVYVGKDGSYKECI